MTRFEQGWRAAGILFPLSSLPTSLGVGDLGPSAEKFAEFLRASGISFWQILPLGPTSPGLGNSPYSSFSAFAGHDLYVSPELMFRDGLLDARDLKDAEIGETRAVNHEKAGALKKALIDKAFARAERKLEDSAEFGEFCRFNGSWLNDYAFFAAAKERFANAVWTEWPDDVKYRRDEALAATGTALRREILRVKFGQWLFFKQLEKLKKRLAEPGISLVGDAPFYVNHDSADVWANRHLFCLDHRGETALMAGVPPDYYSKTGQLWGNPVYDWPRHKESGHAWWRSRIRHNLGLFDWVRLDHFRAFSAFWAVAAGEKTAEKGVWKPGPGRELFEFPDLTGPLKIMAEDLGIITPDVTALRKSLGLPGVRVLQFGVGDPTGLSIHCPYRVEPDNVIFSSTHDTDTAVGWWKNELTPGARKVVSETVGYEVTEKNIAPAMVRLAWLSPAAVAVTTIQDLLGADERERVNVPGTASGNWTWKLPDFAPLSEKLSERLLELTNLAGRDNQPHPNILTYRDL